MAPAWASRGKHRWWGTFGGKGLPQRFTRGNRAGGVIAEPPATGDAPGSCDNPTHPDAFIEILTSLRVDDNGGAVNQMRVDYTVGGRQYQVSIPLEYTACGRGAPKDYGQSIDVCR